MTEPVNETDFRSRITWALTRSVPNVQKLLLVSMITEAETSPVDPGLSTERLAGFAKIAERTASRHLTELVSTGMVLHDGHEYSINVALMESQR